MTAHEVLGLIRTERELEELVHTLGILPFFRNSIPGFSVEENVRAFTALLRGNQPLQQVTMCLK